MSVDTFQCFLFTAQGGKHSYLAKLCRIFWLFILGSHTYFTVWKAQMLRRRKTSSIYWLNYLLARSTAMYFDHFSSGLPSIHSQLCYADGFEVSASTPQQGWQEGGLQKGFETQQIHRTSVKLQFLFIHHPAMKLIRSTVGTEWCSMAKSSSSNRFTGKGGCSLLHTFSPWSLSTDLQLSKWSERSEELYKTWPTCTFSPETTAEEQYNNSLKV